MLTISKYVKAQSLQEAYDLLQKKNHEIIGGMLWMKMQDRNLACAIDLSGLGLDSIEETDECFSIGCMTTLRELEKHIGLNRYTNGAIEESVKHIVGVQFRNVATVGGSIFGRYGFSDVLTIFMGMNAKVELFHGGIVSVEEFSKMKYEKDILVRVIVDKTDRKVAYMTHRNTQTDFPVVTCASFQESGKFGCVIGARPGKAILIKDENNILETINDETIKAFAAYVSENARMASHMRGSKEYRERLCRTLVKRTISQLVKEGASC